LFDEVLKKGIPARSPHFSLAILKDTALLKPKIAVIVSKKVAGKATLRNRLRRQARAWVKAYFTQSLASKKVIVVVFVNTAWQGSFPAALAQELVKLFSTSL